MWILLIIPEMDYPTTCLAVWSGHRIYSISKEICTRLLLCCALLWLYIDWFSHIHQANFTGTVASKATLMNMDKYFRWIHYERLHNHNKAKHNKTVCIFLGIYCKHQTKISLKCDVLTILQLYDISVPNIWQATIVKSFNEILEHGGLFWDNDCTVK